MQDTIMLKSSEPNKKNPSVTTVYNKHNPWMKIACVLLNDINRKTLFKKLEHKICVQRKNV